MQEWSPNVDIRLDFTNLPRLGQHGYAFIQYFTTHKNRTAAPSSIFGYLVRMNSDTKIFKVWVPSEKKIMPTRSAYFRKQTGQHLPNFSSLIDSIARQRAQREANEEPSEEKDQLIRAFIAEHTSDPLINVFARRQDRDPSVPRFFKEACSDRKWCIATDREFNDLLTRGTWQLVNYELGMSPVPFTWNFTLKVVNANKNIFQERARCCLRGDEQQEWVEYDSNATDAHGTAHESLRMLFDFAAAGDLNIEGADIFNDYLF